MENQRFPENGHAVGEQARAISERVATSLTGISDRVRDGSASLANRLDDAAHYLRDHEPRDFAQDLYGLVRRHPWQVLGGIGITYLAIKLLRR
jgi:hypothetical protein